MGSFRESDDDVLCDINTTPLIDVMLVLLIMLIVTIPIQLHAVNLALPGASAAPTPPPAVSVRIEIDAAGRIRWDGALLEDDAALQVRLREAAARHPAPELQLLADPQARYAVVAHVLADTRRLGLDRVAMLGGERFE